MAIHNAADNSFKLQIPRDMNKLLVDVTVSLFEKKGYKRWEAEDVASLISKAERKEYGGMYEAVIESIQEGQQEAWAEGRKEGLEEDRKYVLGLLNQGLSVEEIKQRLERKTNGNGN